MDFDNDIGNFGLPPLHNSNTDNHQNNKSSSRLSRPQKVRGVKKTIKPKKKCSQKNDIMNQQPLRRYNVTNKNSCIGRTMDYSVNDKNNESSDGSSDDDEIALSDLAKKMAPPPRKLPNSSFSHRRAVVTPASFFTNQPTRQHSRSTNSKRKGRNNNSNESTNNGEGRHGKKFKRQIGLDSFLQDKQRQVKTITTNVPNLKLEEVDANCLSSLQHEKEDRNHNSLSFVSASSLLGGNDTNKEELAGSDTSFNLMDQPNEEEVGDGSKAPTSSSNSAEDEVVEFDDDDDIKEPANGNKPCTKEENSSNNLPQRFGIHSLILGRNLPIMHPEEYYRAASTATTTAPSPTDTPVIQAGGEERQQQQQQNTHINRNILSHLLQRTYCHKSSTCSSNHLTRYIHSNTNQSSTESVQLSSSSSNNNNSEICAMAFDTMGILLAMGDNRGKIDIFDFDEVYSADLNKRNEWSRHCYEYQVGTASGGPDRDGDDDKKECSSTTDTNHGDNAEEEGADKVGEEAGNDTAVPPLPPTKVNPVHSFQCQFIHGNATRNNNYLDSANRPRISGIYWNPDNQDHLAVSFENKSEIHLYDVASSKLPPPCLRVGESSSSRGGNGMGTQQQRCEGVLSMRFIHSPARGDGKSSWSGGTQIITGGAFGSVRLWSIPSTKQVGKRRRRCCISEVNAKCMWSMPVFGSSGDGVSDMLILPVLTPHHTTSIAATTSTATTTKPLVLLSGGASSTLVLLNTNKCTRKAFSTSITPTIAASWNLHQLASRELAKIDAKACLPDRRWMSARNMRLIEYRRLTEEGGSWWCKIGLVTNAGWVFAAELVWSNNTPRLSIRVVHHTPRIQCFNSSNVRITNLGGMALQYSLPNAPVPSSDCVRMASNNMIWLADVKGKKYTMPSKDKYVLCEDHNTLEVLQDEEVSSGTISESSSENGIILVSLDTANQYNRTSPATRNTVTRLSLPMSSRTPLALGIHPGGEWMVVGCGKDDSTSLRLIRLRKKM